MSASRRPAPRSGLFLSLGAALVGPGVLAGCAPESPPPAEAPAALQGVETVVRQLPDGSYRIDDEQLVEGSTGRVTVIHLDETQPGGTRTEVLDTPEAFAARLPAMAPDSAAFAGAGGGWEEPGGAGSSTAEARPAGGGFSLGNVLLMSAMYSMWRPMGYGAAAYAPSPRAFTDERARERSTAAGGGAYAAARRGTLATPGRAQAAQRAPAARATSPSGGRSGAFASPSGRSGGG